MIALLLFVGLVLLLLNAFFVLAEFGSVRMRPSRVQELVDQGNPKAKVVQHVQQHLDDYLSVCQLGITFASIGLGFVGEPAVARLIEPVFAYFGSTNPTLVHSIAITIAYIAVSFLHITVGELVPKSLAIRSTERATLFTARPLKFFHTIFYVPLLLLNHTSNVILAMLGVPREIPEDPHSEDELRIILGKSQTGGLMPFRRLLLVENVFDLGELTVKDAMKPRDSVKVLHASAPWEDNYRVFRESRLSRLPLMGEGTEKPLGIIHIKDLFYLDADQLPDLDLKKLARPYYSTTEDAALENLLSEFQRRRIHLAIVLDKTGRWTGLITLEDVIEEIVGTVEDEFEAEPPIYVADALQASRIVLGVEADSIEDGIRRALAKIPPGELPVPADAIAKSVRDRVKVTSTYLGGGLAVANARSTAIDRPLLVFARSDNGLPIKGRQERVRLIFILMTPAHLPHVQARLLTRIGGLTESEYVEQRLLGAESAQEVLEAVRAGETAVLG